MAKKLTNKNKWDVDEAEAIYWIAPEAVYSALFGMKKVYGFSFSRIITFFDQDRVFKWCMLNSELKKIGSKCLNKFKSEAFRQKVKMGFSRVSTKVDKKILNWQKLDPSKLSIEKLYDLLSFFTACYQEIFNYGFFVEPLNYVFSDELKKILSKYKLTDDEFSNLTAIADITFLNKHRQQLLSIALRALKKQNIEKELNNHLKKYEWLASGHTGMKKINTSYFKKILKDLSKDKQALEMELDYLKNYKKVIRNEQKKICQSHNFNKQAIEMIKIINSIGPLHDHRKEIFVKTIYYSDCLRKEIGKRFGYTLYDLQYFELKELQQLKTGKKFNRDEINKRHEFMLLDANAKRMNLYTGKKAVKYLNPEFKQNYNKSKKLDGTVASPGHAKGKAKIIFGGNSFNKMNKGDILITSMTRPDMVIIMKKASAIITDLGGLTCHAAIVSRELKIPCIVDTEIATKVFKDGDKVEVDANKGVIKKI